MEEENVDVVVNAENVSAPVVASDLDVNKIQRR